ncbi:MAG TPA: segregation/condensation protein A [Candidatus Paceibacterota bacterium]|nr:segregation/condensation protein A [Candidatus Paceibacterota bacterium]
MDTETLENVYTVKTPVFEGPFGILLSMVEDRKLFINDVSLASVTEDYLRYINLLEKTNPLEVASFMIVAATLILIKSKSLLPNLELTAEEESDISNLTDRLKLYEMYIRLGGEIKPIFGKKIIFAPLERKQETVMFLPDNQITKENMMTLVSGVLGRMPKKEFIPEVEVKKVISIEEMIDNLTQRIQTSLRMSFKEWTGKGATKEERVTVIVSFLAMLELVRQGLLEAVQENSFEDIMIERQIEESVSANI